MDLTIPESMGGKKAIKGLLEIDFGAKVMVSSVYSTDSIIAKHKDYGFKGML